MPRILIVDDEKSMREFLSIFFKKEGYEVVAFPTGKEALEYYRQTPCDIVISDMKMPGMTGLELLKSLKELNPDVIVIMLTAYASVDTAIEAMKAGAYDYFTKPFNVDEVRIQVRRVLELKTLERENILLKKSLKTKYGFSKIVGASPVMTEVYQAVMSVAPSKANVLISGESGTGKELIARAIHDESQRKDASFVSVNCGAIPENLLESELFGHVKGAFTGAVANKPGLAELADGGTLFLDEITEMPLLLQVKLLRFIQERTFRRVGATADTQVDIRIVAATNRNIESEVKAQRFREDLYYRLNVIRIDMPPLRERKEDIPMLAKYFLSKYCAEQGKHIESISEDALALLLDYEYPGNVRELENAMERAVALETTGKITAKCLPSQLHHGASDTSNGIGGDSVGSGLTAFAAEAAGAIKQFKIPDEGVDLERMVADYESTIIEEALKRSGGVRMKAAELLGISFRSLRYKLSKIRNNVE